jgi:hypothetical protein
MQNLLPLILIGFFVYLIFFRKGGMGCCGSHGSHEPKRHQDGHSDSGNLFQDDRMEKVIDLNKDEYTILPSRKDQDHTQT